MLFLFGISYKYTYQKCKIGNFESYICQLETAESKILTLMDPDERKSRTAKDDLK